LLKINACNFEDNFQYSHFKLKAFFQKDNKAKVILNITLFFFFISISGMIIEELFTTNKDKLILGFDPGTLIVYIFTLIVY
jgi:hypothetical protein